MFFFIIMFKFCQANALILMSGYYRNNKRNALILTCDSNGFLVSLTDHLNLILVSMPQNYLNI